MLCDICYGMLYNLCYVIITYVNDICYITYVI